MERVQVGITVERHVYEALKARGATMNMKPADYARRLFEAAWAARGGQDKGVQASDMDLGLQIRLVFALSGDGDIPGIARATRLPEGLVRNILLGFRHVAEERREARSFEARPAGLAPQSFEARPAGFAPQDKGAAPVAELQRIGARGKRYSDEEIETVRTMWAAGSTTREIAAAIGRSQGTFEMWASNHRDVCPKRRG